MKFFDTKYMYAILALIVFGSFCFGALFYKVVIDDSPSPVVDTRVIPVDAIEALLWEHRVDEYPVECDGETIYAYDTSNVACVYWSGWEQLRDDELLIYSNCAGSIAVLNEALVYVGNSYPESTLAYQWEHCGQVIDSLKQHIDWLWTAFGVTPSYYTSDTIDPCAGMVYIEAVEGCMSWEECIYRPKQGVDSFRVFDWYAWQRLTERSR